MIVIICSKLVPDFRQNFGAPYYVVHRAHFHMALYKRALELGVDVKVGPRSIKGRESSAAEVIACAIQLIGWELDESVTEIVDEVTLIDTGRHREAVLDMGLIIRGLRSAGWSDDAILRHVICSLLPHMSPPSEVAA